MAAGRDDGDGVSLAQRRAGVKWRLLAMRRLWAPEAERHAPFIPPPPPPPPPPNQGNIDGPFHVPSPDDPEPAAADVDPNAPEPPVKVDDEILRVRGWSTFAAGPTTRVEVFLDGAPLGNARIGVNRADVVAAMPDEPYVEVAGFELDIASAPLRRTGEREGAITAVAFGPADEKLELEPLPIRLVVPELDDDEDEDEVTPMPAPAAFTGRPGRRTLVITHQLTLGGAQLYLMDLLREQLSLGLIDPIVVSTIDGPLRKELEALDVPVHITSLVPPDNLKSYQGKLDEFLTWARPLGAELVLVNTSTSTTVVGGEIAVDLGIPSVWAIHESFEPVFLWADIAPRLRIHAESVIGNASSAVFEADATRHIYEGMIDPARCHTIPYGLDLAPIDKLRASFDKDEARRKAGVPTDARLVVCIGTVEPRKAQVPLAIAFDLIGAKHPDSRLAFVGGRPGARDTVALEDCIAASPRHDQMEVIPITPDVAEWYGMADLLVCASDVESLPRTVLEAMAWGTPVLATSVFGLPELIDDGETGWLCEPRDSRALADALDRALSADEATYASIARDARALVEKRHGLKHYAEEMARQFDEAIASAS
jgi:glycosyltransferase involved in cell wall biosynthesis